MDQDKINLGTS